MRSNQKTKKEIKMKKNKISFRNDADYVIGI